MKISDALQGIQRLFIDTNPVIYLIEHHPNYLQRARQIFQEVHRGQLVAMSSVVTLAEVLVHPLRTGNTSLEQAYRRILSNSYNFSLITLTPPIAATAADLRARYNLKTPDAFQMAAAWNSGCDAFLTNDHGLKRVTEIQIFVMDDLQLG